MKISAICENLEDLRKSWRFAKIFTICENFENICTLPYKVIGQKAGIRPTVNDRRPLLGEHPHKKNMFVFNGLGTKGVMLAPFLSQHFVEHLLGKTTLLSEVDIKRHYKKHYA